MHGDGQVMPVFRQKIRFRNLVFHQPGLLRPAVPGGNGGGNDKPQIMTLPRQKQAIGKGHRDSLARLDIGDVQAIDARRGILQHGRRIAIHDRILVAVFGQFFWEISGR